ncbi:MAG: glycosyltransferase [Flammeovirgaceae bacterium]|nr:MAG: glycosyltransferase [Flammeovirgaceae bacterium]
MKIIQLIQKKQLRGAEIFASQLSNHLTATGHDVLLVSLFPGDAELPFTGKHFSLNRPLSKRFWDFFGWRLLSEQVCNFQPDVVQANAGDTLKFAVISKLFFGWKAKIIFRNANKVSDFVTSVPKVLFNRFLVRQVDQVISVSELCRMDFIKTYGYPSRKVTTVPIGLNLEPVSQSLPHDLVQFLSSGKVLVHVASFVPEKNHKGLLRVIQKLVAQGKDVKVILIGDGKLRPEVEEQIKNMALTDRVLVAGYRSEVLSIMATAHMLVLPSLIEGLPGVVLEAMYCRIPVVAYNVGGISEVVKPQETGWLVEKNDEAGFIEAVVEVLEGSNVERITDNAFNMVVNDFDNRVIAKRFEKVYKEVVERM